MTAKRYVTGPDGAPMTLADLPCVATKRWTPKRKAEIVFAVRGGLIDLAEACARYRITSDEYANWQELEQANGLAGLRVTRCQEYRAAAE